MLLTAWNSRYSDTIDVGGWCRQQMSLLSRLLSGLFNRSKPAPTVNLQITNRIPTIRFDSSRVTESVKADLAKSIRRIKEFESHFDAIYEAALLSVSRGRYAAVLYDAIMKLNIPTMTKERASEICRRLNNKATSLMNRQKSVSIGITEAIWMHSGAPCHVNPRKPTARDAQRDNAHRAADGKRYNISKGMRIGGRYVHPGDAPGCKCASRSVLPGE
jgi:hypothetical protein